MPEIIYSKAETRHSGIVHRLLQEMAPTIRMKMKASPEDILRLMTQKDTLALEAILAWVKGTNYAVGLLTFYPNISTYEAKLGMYIEDIYVNREHERIGIGRRLVAEAAALVKRRGYCRMEWHAPLDNQDAIDFYEGLGGLPQKGWILFRGQNTIDDWAANAEGLVESPDAPSTSPV